MLRNNAWRRFVRWLAREELAAADEQLRAFGRSLITGAQSGTKASLREALSEACRRWAPVAVTWSIEQRSVEDLAPGQLRVVVEQSSFPRSAA
jgi:hypothetical protein